MVKENRIVRWIEQKDIGIESVGSSYYGTVRTSYALYSLNDKIENDQLYTINRIVQWFEYGTHEAMQVLFTHFSLFSLSLPLPPPLSLFALEKLVFSTIVYQFERCHWYLEQLSYSNTSASNPRFNLTIPPNQY